MSRISTSKPSRRAVSSARRVMASGISSGTIGRVGTPVCSPRILSCCCAAGRRVSSEAIMTLRLVEKVPPKLGRHALRALAQAIADLGAGRGLARALQADHQDDDRRDGVEVEVGDRAAQHLDQVIVDDLDDHLARRDRADDVGADRLGPHPSMNWRTTGRATSASSRAVRTSRRAASTSASESAPRPRSLSNTSPRRLLRPSNMPLRHSVRPNDISRRCANLRGSAELPEGGTGRNRHDRLSGRGIRPAGQGVKRLGDQTLTH